MGTFSNTFSRGMGSQGALLNPSTPSEDFITFEGDTDLLTFEGDTENIKFELIEN
jgi:hypothetical protein